MKTKYNTGKTVACSKQRIVET